MLFDAGCVACDDRFGPVCGACSQALISAPVMTVAGVDVVRVGYALDERAKTIVAALKYKRQRRLATVLAQQLQTLVPRGADAITWIPATPARRRSRGYDQAEELARAFSRCSGVPALRLVSRRDTDVRQTGLSRVDRLRGPSLASAAPSPDFVVLVDDVITTGSSLRVGAQVARASGATRIVGVALAATPPQYAV